MKIVFLASTAADLAWFRTYYRAVFPAGSAHARSQYERTLAILAGNARIGHTIAEADIREYSIPRTPFSIIYRIKDDRIEVLRLFDQRGSRADIEFGD